MARLEGEDYNQCRMAAEALEVMLSLRETGKAVAATFARRGGTNAKATMAYITYSSTLEGGCRGGYIEIFERCSVVERC